MANYVISRRWKPGKRERFEVVNGSLTTFVRKLKRRPGKDIYLGGGSELARSFLQEDLVDELFIGVGPILLGDGFPGKFPQRDFKLTDASPTRMDRSRYVMNGCRLRLADNRSVMGCRSRLLFRYRASRVVGVPEDENDG